MIPDHPDQCCTTPVALPVDIDEPLTWRNPENIRYVQFVPRENEFLMVIIRGAQSESPVHGVADTPNAVPRIDPLHARAAEEFADDVAADRRPSIRAIRARLHAGQLRAQQVQVHLGILIEAGEVKETDSYQSEARQRASETVEGRRNIYLGRHRKGRSGNNVS